MGSADKGASDVQEEHGNAQTRMPLRRHLPVRWWLHLRPLIHERGAASNGTRHPLSPNPSASPERRRLEIRRPSRNKEQPNRPCRVEDLGQDDADRVRLRESLGRARPALHQVRQPACDSDRAPFTDHRWDPISSDVVAISIGRITDELVFDAWFRSLRHQQLRDLRDQPATAV